ncbi:hypothetical protein [Ralstonia pseudosolanacearum]|uniref:hypothetical protein n=1 Tax=Ralstonia pseudosolanacearum TaxID=1310165 RepID=UPI003CEEF876
MTLLLPSGPLHGVNSTLVKQAARFLLEVDSAELFDFAISIGVDERTAEPIWRKFIVDGYIEQREDGQFAPSHLMEQLVAARFGKPLPREKADALLQKSIENAKGINAEPPSAELYYVTKVAVFGSFLDETKCELGDLDLAWEIALRPGVVGFDYHCLMYNRDSVAPTRGRFRPKSPFVRLASMDNLLSLECPYRLVYEFHHPSIDQVREIRAKHGEEYWRLVRGQLE